MTDMGTTSRRAMLAAGAVGGAGALLAACGSGGGNSGSGSGSGGDGYGAGGGDEAGGAQAPQPATGTKLAAVDDIPMGGSKVVDSDGKPVALVRSGENQVTAFSALCTHKGCKVEPSGAELTCPCHGSVFETTSGRPTNGPADEPLAKVDVYVEGSTVLAGKARS